MQNDAPVLQYTPVSVEILNFEQGMRDEVLAVLAEVGLVENSHIVDGFFSGHAPKLYNNFRMRDEDGYEEAIKKLRPEWKVRVHKKPTHRPC